MPVPVLPEPDTSADQWAANVDQEPAGQLRAMGMLAGAGIQRASSFLGAINASDADEFDRQVEESTSGSFRLSPDEANARFGIPGALAFKTPIAEEEAAFKSNETHRRLFEDDVVSRAGLNPLESIGASLAGGIVDPIGLPLMFAPEMLGLRAGIEGVLGGEAATDAAGVIAKSSRLANGARSLVAGGVEGAAGMALNEAEANPMNRYAGQDYTLADSLNQIVLGAVLGAGGGAVHGLFFRATDRAAAAAGRLNLPEGEAPLEPAERAAGLPPEVAAVPPGSRLAAVAKAIDDAADDRPQTVGNLIDAELARDSHPEDLDETQHPPGQIGLKPLHEDVAITPKGQEIPVRYALAEMGDLKTSHDTSMQVNPDYPAALQPRDRARAGSIAANLDLENRLNPKLLMDDRSATAGAPIIAADGTVESGNGRTIALARSAASGSPAWGKYLQALQARGLDTAGFQRPVLVRVRTEPMSGDARIQLARDMNEDVTERMASSEQATADAAQIGPVELSHLDGTPEGQRVFARAFFQTVAPRQLNAMVTAGGVLSQLGAARMKAALVAKAFGDPALVRALSEEIDAPIKAVGAALGEAAPAWAAMRALAARGEIPAALDITDHLKSAVALLRAAREAREPTDAVIAQHLRAQDLLSGEAAVSPETELMLRLFFRDENFRLPRSAAKVAEALKDYARRAGEVTPGEDLFGETANEQTAHAILERVAARFQHEPDTDELGPLGASVREDGGQRGEPQPIDLRPEGGDGGAGPGDRAAAGAADGGRPADHPAGPGPAGRPGDAGAVAPGEKASGAADPVAADPELEAIAANTEAWAAANGAELEPPAAPAKDPATLAKAIRAAALCLAEDL